MPSFINADINYKTKSKNKNFKSIRYELEILEAKHFLPYFSLNGEVNLEKLKNYISNIKELKKQKRKGEVKKYFYLLRIIDLPKTNAAIHKFYDENIS